MNLPQVPRIAHILDVPDAAPTLARWFVEEWQPWYGPDGPGDAERDLAACGGRDRLPLCLVALDGETPLGTAALKADSVGSELGVGPWLSAFLVDEAHRRRGIGSALVAAIETEAARLGFPAIYTSTGSAAGLLQRRGWQPFGASQSLRGPVEVYRCELAGGEPQTSTL
ncbi:MAG: GNAT family N-acetyltransferase [Kiloniellales bacterium]|nr:GNAT family N-acetyltransferase [Kiloniellales bacterium]